MLENINGHEKVICSVHRVSRPKGVNVKSEVDGTVKKLFT